LSVEPGEVQGAWTLTLAPLSTAPVSATMVLRARSKLSNCTVTRLEFWQALGGGVRSGDAQSVLARCIEMPDALPPRCLRDILWAYDERIPAVTGCSLSRAGKAHTDVGADGLLWTTALWSQYECRHLFRVVGHLPAQAAMPRAAPA